MPLQVLLILNTLPCCAVTKTHERNVVIQISHFTPARILIVILSWLALLWALRSLLLAIARRMSVVTTT